MNFHFCLQLCFLLLIAQASGFEVLAEYVRLGSQSTAALVLAGDGNYYGTCSAGGALGFGTVFRVTPAGELSTVVSFSGTAGATLGGSPTGKLVAATDGALYGTTINGGNLSFGTAFKVTTSGVFTTLVNFTGTAGAAKGSAPQALVQHTDGNFYGVTLAGGGNGFGTVFRLTSAGVLTTLLEFTGTAGTARGAQPQGPLAFSGTNLYGVTKTMGASGFGTIYRITTAGVWTNIADFTGTAGTRPGANPAGGLFLNTDNNLYGTTEFGGTNGFGQAFRVTTTSTPTVSNVRTFADASGSQPVGVLVRGSDGQLYGTTAAGGTSGFGVVYKMTTGGTQTVLANFTGEAGVTPGSAARSGLITVSGGGFMGVTSAGGPGNYGVVYTLSSAGAFAVLSQLAGTTGWFLSGAPTFETANSLLFPLAAGGPSGAGAIARASDTGVTSVAAPLSSTVGLAPVGALIKAGNDFYGVTTSGGAASRGTAYKYNASAGASLLANFTSTTGALAEGPLLLEGAELFGLSREGGTLTRGTFSKIDMAGTRTRLTSFSGTSGATKGTKPRGPVAFANGSFYGVAELGGANNVGTLFSLSPAGAYTLLAEFSATGPRQPLGGLLKGLDGMIYGSTSLGGANNAGTLFRLDTSNNTWTVVADFTPASTGGTPVGPLVNGPGGYVYGLCSAGGTAGLGGIFRWSPFSSLELLDSFTGAGGPSPGFAAVTDAAGTFTGGVGFGPDGRLYGTAAGGGQGGGGVLFRLSPTTPFHSWKQAELGSSAALDLADPEADGVSALLEYALGLDPQTNDVSALPASTLQNFSGEKYLTITVPRDPARPDLVCCVESSASLTGPWTALAVSAAGQPYGGPGYVSGDSATSGPKNVVVRDLVSVATGQRRFMRFRVAR